METHAKRHRAELGDSTVKIAAARVQGHSAADADSKGMSLAVHQLVRMLGSNHVGVRHAAASAFGEIGAEAAPASSNNLSRMQGLLHTTAASGLDISCMYACM